jgi:uncharacterized membrane protein
VFLEFASGAAVQAPTNTRQENAVRTPASIAGHPIHVMLVSLPIGLWIFSLICDVILITGHNPDLWFSVAYVTMAGGIAGALLAAVFGLIDLSSLPRGHTRNVALAHMAINVAVVAVFAFDLYLRTGDLESMTLPLLLSIAGILMLAVSGWLGGELVHVHMVGVDPDEAVRRAEHARREPGHRGAEDARSHT